MGRIAILSEELINKIAAGEVVERPASIVKELIENSLDGQARHVRIALAAGGCGRISIADDGVGMSPTDAELALMRHATSKLRDLEDLFRITTLGFRGEALPAIASVSRFSLSTSEPGAAAGFRLRVEGGKIVECADAAPIGGTAIDVEDLFYNVPARRKFMRRQQTELWQAQEAVVRLALAHPEVGFALEHEGRALLSCPPNPTDQRERLALAMGAELYPHLVEVEERRLGISVTGYIASPDFTLPSARGIYTFVNRRYVRDRGLNHSIQRAFRDILPQGRQPVAALMIEVEPSAVDVNVHPQKLEVRFADAASVYDAVFSALYRALRRDALADLHSGSAAAPTVSPSYARAVQQFLERAHTAPGGARPLWTIEPTASYGGLSPKKHADRPVGYFSSLRYVGTVRGRYWVCEGADGFLVALDSHAALERVRRDVFERAWSQRGAALQRSLFSAAVTVTHEQMGHLEAHANLLQEVGIEVERFGRDSLALKSLPSELLGADHSRLLGDLAAKVSRNGELAARDLLPILACHAAARAASLSADQVRALIQDLDRLDFRLKVIHASIVALEVPLPEGSTG